MSAQLENGYTRIANEIADVMCVLKISNYESRFLWALFRKTYGFHKKEDRISLSQFSKITNIKSNHIARTKASLLEKNIIYQKNGKIGIVTDVPSWVVPEQGVPRLVSSSTSLGVKVVPEQVHTKEKKETIQKIDSVFSLLKEEDKILYMKKYSIKKETVEDIWETMVNSRFSQGKMYKDWKLALHNWIKPELKKNPKLINKNTSESLRDSGVEIL